MLYADIDEIIDGTVKPQTNADRIQEKLAETLSGMCKIAEQCDDCPMEGNCPGGSYDLSVWAKWLHQQAEGEGVCLSTERSLLSLKPFC